MSTNQPSAPSMSLEDVPVKRGMSIEEAKKLIDEFDEMGTHGHTDDLMFSYREVWQLVLAQSLLAASEQREKILKPIQKLINEQAEDPGLWFMAKNASERYLQEELRALHAIVEAQSRLPAEHIQ